ncbi:MAG: TonB-dependent receptor [Chitinophagaceae bacterium]|nr:TonB-dependent receptor [Chitinophagaceae bacterium]
MRKIYSTTRYSGALLFCFFLSLGAIAQAVIKGTVSNANGQTLSGASVVVQEGKKGTTTDINGFYTLSVSPGRQTLVISYVGYGTQTLAFTASSGTSVTQNIQMKEAGDLTEVTVTGSRAVGRTRIETAVPVDVIPLASVINDLGQVDLNQILNFIAPSFQSSRQTVADGTDHVDPAQLRGLGTDQVLVLINGKRRHQSALVNVNGTVNRGQVGTDLSAIPPTAIERVEILRDGAAAQYGSDAIAGVINIILKKKTGLLEAGSSYGAYVTKYPKNYARNRLAGKTSDDDVKMTDGNSFQASLGYGFAIGKGYLTLTGEYIKRINTNRTGTFTGAVFPNVNGVNRDDSILSAKGLTRNDFDIRAGNSAMKGGTVFYNFGIPVGQNGEFYAFGGYGKKKGEAAGFFRYPSGYPGNATIYAANARDLYPNGFLPLIKSDILDFSTAVGYRTKFSGWNFDISNTYGINTFDFGVENSVNYTQFINSANKQTSFDAGGLKFWQNTTNADFSKKFDVAQGLNFAAGLEYRVDAFGIKSGEEGSYKNYDVNSRASGGAQVFPGFLNTIGNDKTRNAKAIYTDLELDVTKAFLVTGALRFENYSDFGSTLNYKVSTRYKLSDNFNVRASVSSGFRAPSMQQRFFAKTNTLFVSQGGNLVPVQAGTFTNDSKPAQILGIPKLQEETSQSYSIGLTAKPVPALEVTVDAYQIDIKNRIILTNNFNGGTDANLKAQLDAVGASTANFFTNAIDTRARGLEAVVSYTKKFTGTHSLRTTLAMTFIDNEVKNGADGKPNIKASPALINSGQLANYFNREDESRVEVATPKNKINLTFNYKYSKWGAMLRFVKFGTAVYLDPSINPANPGAFPINAFTGQRETLDQEFDGKVVTDLSLSYQVTKAVSATIGANNLFDVYQDIQKHSSNQSSGRFIYSRRVQQMGFNGAYYFGRLNFSLNTKK